jgi:hypothetical protein
MKRSITSDFAGPVPQPGARLRLGKAAGFGAAALLCLASIAAPNLAQARGGGGGGGGGGMGGGGFHGGGMGGFHGGGMGGFHGGGMGGFHGGGFGGFHSGDLGGSHPTAPAAFQGSGSSSALAHPEAPASAGMDSFHAGGFRGGSDNGTVVLHGDMRGGQWHQGRRDGSYGWYSPYLWSSDGFDDGYYDGDTAVGQPYAGQSWYYCSSPAGYYPYVSQCSVSWQTVPAG